MKNLMNKVQISIFLVMIAVSIYAAPGDLDTTFSGDGKELFNFTSPLRSGIRGSALQSDGKIVAVGFAVVGNGHKAAVVRYNADGSLDSTFGNAGAVLFDFAPTSSNEANDVVIQADGKIVVVGSSSVTFVHRLFSLARLNSNGTFDTTFDTDGIVTTVFTAGRNEEAKAVGIDSNSKIVVAGTATNDLLAVAKYNSDGSLDTTFDLDGKRELNSFSLGKIDMAIQPDNKIVIASADREFNTGIVGICITRVNPNGSLDTTFGGDGDIRTTVGTGTFSSAAGIAIQTDGKIVIAGTTNNELNSNTFDFLVIRYEADGSSPVIFQTPIASGSGNDFASDLKIQTDQKIVVCGYSNFTSQDFSAIRLNTDLTLDTTFSSDGKARTDFTGGDDQSGTLQIQNDGSIIILGATAGDLSGNILVNSDFAAIRYDSSGSLDFTFDSDGKAITELGNDATILNAIAVQPDGKIVGVGKMDQTSSFSIPFLFRVNSDGSLDLTFGTNGIVLLPSFPGTTYNAIKIQPDSKILIGGVVSSFLSVMRFNSNGTMDFFAPGRSSISLGFPTNSNPILGDLLLQNDGKILITGRGNSGTGNNVILARFNSDGSQDGATVSTDLFNGTNETGKSIAIQPDGKILIASTAFEDTNQDFAIIRYNTDLTLDTTFSGDGFAIVDFGLGDDFANSLSIQTDGKIVVTGSASNGTNTDIGIVRLNTNGSLDSTFSGDGKNTVAIGSGDDSANSLKIQANGRIVVGGFITNAMGRDFATVRFNSDGTLDNLELYGTGGISTADMGGDDVINSIAIRSNGNIVAAGESNGNGAMAQFVGDPLAPTAANSSISGRVTRASGRGIVNATVSVTNTRTGETRHARTSSFGYYSFEDLESAETYVLSVNAKRYAFSNPSRVITLTENLSDVDFVSDGK